MCGIVGAWRGSDPSGRVRRAVVRLRHRGPDGRGLWSRTGPAGSLALGHTRLAIIDPGERGRQPMCSASGRYVITFNGEIYNYVELRDELRRGGASFTSGTDTEVLLEAWERWGPECLPRLVGMFAFAVFDTVREHLTLVRDPFGIKPLFLHRTGDGLAFASEVAALQELMDSRPAPDVQTCAAYLMSGEYDGGHRTFFGDIERLEPGTALTLDHADEYGRTTRWWSPDPSRRSGLSFESAVEAVREEFLSSVRMHLRSDVPVGAMLSGGIDSSAIVCAIRHLEPDRPLHTFSYVASEPQYSERRWIDIINRQVEARAHVVQAKPRELERDLEELIVLQGEPFGTTSIYAQFRVFRAMSEAGIPVALEGQGADELLAGYQGYPDHRLHSLVETGHPVRALRFALGWGSGPGRSLRWAGRSFLRHLRTGGAHRVSAPPDWIRGDVLDSLPDPGRAGEFRERAGRGRRVMAELARSIQGGDLQRLLRHGDRNAMHHSVENRVPFLTPAMADLLLGLPESYLLGMDGETKRVFRAAMRGIVPDEILNRRDKIGFVTPQDSWLRETPDLVQRGVESASRLDFIHRGELLRALEEWRSGRSPRAPVWRWVNLGLWHERMVAP